jgi:hypothetical protein
METMRRKKQVLKKRTDVRYARWAGLETAMRRGRRAVFYQLVSEEIHRSMRVTYLSTSHHALLLIISIVGHDA